MAIKFFIFILGLLSCNLDNDNDLLKAVKATAVFPNFDLPTGKLIYYDTSTVLIFYTKDLVVYKLHYILDSVTTRSYRDSIVTDRYVSVKRDHYFIYQKGKDYGYDYDPYKSFMGRKVPLDMIFKNEWCVQNKLYPIFGDVNIVNLISSYKSKNADTLKESYFIKSKTYSNQSASVFLEYCASLKDIEFSLSRELDSVRNSKLSKIRIANDPMKINDTLTFDKYETYYEINRLEQFDQEEVLMYIKQFEIDRLKEKE